MKFIYYQYSNELIHINNDLKNYLEVIMSLKFKLTSVIFVMILAVMVVLSVFVLTRPNRDMTIPAVIFAVAILAAAVVVAFLLVRSVARPVDGAADTRGISGDEGLAMRINDNFEDEAGAIEGTVTNTQSAATTLVKNDASVKCLIESYETGLAEMQDVVTDIRDIIKSIDNVLQEFEAIGS